MYSLSFQEDFNQEPVILLLLCNSIHCLYQNCCFSSWMHWFIPQTCYCILTIVYFLSTKHCLTSKTMRGKQPNMACVLKETVWNNEWLRVYTLKLVQIWSLPLIGYVTLSKIFSRYVSQFAHLWSGLIRVIIVLLWEVKIYIYYVKYSILRIEPGP